jgi:hypothetical protein
MKGCRHLATLDPPLARCQAFVPVQPIHLVLANLLVSAVQHVPNPPVAVAHPSRRNLLHPLARFFARIPIAPVFLCRTFLFGQTEGPPFAAAVETDQVGHHAALSLWLGNFFVKTSCNTVLSRRTQAPASSSGHFHLGAA